MAETSPLGPVPPEGDPPAATGHEGLVEAVREVRDAVHGMHGAIAGVHRAVEDNAHVTGYIAGAMAGRVGTPGAASRLPDTSWNTPILHKAGEVREGVTPWTQHENEAGYTIVDAAGQPVIARNPAQRQRLTVDPSHYNMDKPRPHHGGSGSTNADASVRYLPWGPNMIRHGREVMTDPYNSKKRRLGGVALALAGVVVSAATIPSPMGPSAIRGSDFQPRPSFDAVRPTRRMEHPAPGRTPIHHNYDYLDPNDPAMPQRHEPGRIRRRGRVIMNRLLGRP
ncbi:MAG TPA: hypothetical protein VLE73_05010 [Candidatus Saccharimonadales bacterium]|nr:hypothetical protein [Candidatus Saccharimonadales bacterium]